ncbi:MAG: YkvA family protein [Candidatus Dormibacteria bacterium]
MLSRIRFAKRLVRDLPQYGKLAYCLVRDDRVPARNKAVLGAALMVGLNPFINFPEFIPVVGELDVLAITLLALRLFIASCPAPYVEEHKQLLVEQRSRFDEDLRGGESTATRFFDRLRRNAPEGPGSAGATVVDVTPSPQPAAEPASPHARGAG